MCGVFAKFIPQSESMRAHGMESVGVLCVDFFYFSPVTAVYDKAIDKSDYDCASEYQANACGNVKHDKKFL